MEPTTAGVPLIVLVLAGALATAGILAWASRRRGGRYRGLPGWVLFWIVFASILVSLSRLPAAISLTMLGLLMFAALRTHFFLAPVRPGDRYAMLAAYLAIPFALYPGFTGSEAAFLATVPVTLFLMFPVLLSVGQPREGLLESMGRLLLGVLLFVFCAAHLGLLVRSEQPGSLELFGVLVLGAELPGRLTGRFRQGGGWARSASGIVAGGLLATALGFWIGPWCGVVEEDGARVGLLVAVAVTMGALVSEAMMHDLSPGAPAVRVGRWAFLDRAIPAVYAAPVYFHYLNYFA